MDRWGYVGVGVCWGIETKMEITILLRVYGSGMRVIIEHQMEQNMDNDGKLRLHGFSRLSHVPPATVPSQIPKGQARNSIEHQPKHFQTDSGEKPPYNPGLGFRV